MITRRTAIKLAASTGMTTLISTDVVPYRTDQSGFRIVDTNISLFRWPFSRLSYDEPKVLIQKLRSLGIAEAWAGSFEGILQRDVTGVNLRLAETCRDFDEFVPIGAINPMLPDWEGDLSRCVVQHRMRGIRLHPNYHGYELDHPRFIGVLRKAAADNILVQIVVAMEDTRTQHVSVQKPDVDLTPLPGSIRNVAGVRVQILNYRPKIAIAQELTKLPSVYFDVARVESTDGVPKLVESVPNGRVMFGSHMPFLIPESALVRVHESGLLADKSLRKVFSENAENVLGRVSHSQAASEQIGLPPRPQLKGYRIWDSYFTPSHSHPGEDGSSRLIADIERSLPAIRTAQFEKLCFFLHVGTGTTSDADYEKLALTNPQLVTQAFEKWPDLLMGMIQLNANNLSGSLDAINRWLRDGPMIGVYFPGGGPGAMTCTHRNFNPLVERIAALNGVIMQHTWFKTGGKQGPGESTPTELAELARRFPSQKFLCAHAGGEWQKGIRAVRETSNVLVETSGFDATSGFIEMAVRDLGAERIVFGSHLPSRSLGTELGKVVAARITEPDKKLILGENFRRIVGSKSTI